MVGYWLAPLRGSTQLARQLEGIYFVRGGVSAMCDCGEILYAALPLTVARLRPRRLLT